MKPGVQFERIDPAGFRLLGTLDRLVRELPYDLTITCGSDSHPPSDPHSLGRAFDVRTHGLTDPEKNDILRRVMLDLQQATNDAPIEVSGGLATMHFFGWVEHRGADNEHIHLQQRNGTTYP